MGAGVRLCSVEGCDCRHWANNFCRMHHARWRRNGDPGIVGKVKRTRSRCRIDGCERPAHAKELCTQHYQRWKKWGESDFAPLRTTGTWSLTDVECAYLAGFIDGEGTIGMKRERRSHSKHGSGNYVPYLSAANTDPQVVMWLQKVFGGGVRKRATTVGGNAKPFVWAWSIGPRATVEACKVLLPFLRMKRPQAELLINGCSDRWGLGGATRRSSPEYWQRLEETWLLLRAMNHRGTAPDEYQGAVLGMPWIEPNARQ